MSITLKATVLAACVAVSSASLAGSPLLSALQAAPGCDHVLDLLNRYGGLEGLPTPSGSAVIGSPMGAIEMPIAEFGDLCIASVEMAPAADGCLPRIILGVTNHSTRVVCNTHVSVVALLGPIKPCDPTANACLGEIPPGATIEVEITLPAEALAMGDNGGTPIGFQQLLIAIDSLDRFVEVNEANNLHLLARAEIAERVAVVVEAAPAAVGAAPTPSVPASVEQRPALDKALESFGIAGPTAGAMAQRL